MELDEALRQLRGALGNWSLEMHISPDLAVRYQKAAGKEIASRQSLLGQAVLGYMYYDGKFTEKNCSGAEKCLLKIAENDGGYFKDLVCYARIMLGDMYYLGQGIEQNYIKAARWYIEASYLFSKVDDICIISLDGYDFVDPQCKDDKWYLWTTHTDSVILCTAADAYNDEYPYECPLVDNGATQRSCVVINRDGHINSDGISSKALSSLSKVAVSGNLDAAKVLGYIYETGHGADKNCYEALKWFRMAADYGDVETQYKLGNMYRMGQGVRQDCREAAVWYRKAAEQGDVESQAELGDMYYSGEGIMQNYALALKWYSAAAEHGDADSQSMIAYMYRYGEGTAKNLAEAVKWYRVAAEQGDSESREALDELAGGAQGSA